MKRRWFRAAVALLLCAAALMSGTLLIFHAEHIHQKLECPFCEAIIQSMELFLFALMASTAVWPPDGILAAQERISPENRFEPDWTPVRRKVKLLN